MGLSSFLMNEEPKKITREELHGMVWTKPFVRLAAELGYSYPELARICTDLNIPRPSGGYWYRLAHGEAEESALLPPPEPGTPTQIPLGPRLLEPEPPPLEPAAEDQPSGTEPVEIPAPKPDRPKPAVQVIPKEEDIKPVETASSGTPKSDETAHVKLPKSIEYTRDQLYQEIWSIPCVKLASKLGVSDVALAKTCRRLGIPRPPRGYWARIEAGERLKKEPLPPAKPGQDSVKFWIAENVARREEWARNNILTAGRISQKSTVELPPEGAELHPVALKHLQALEKAKPGELGFVSIQSKNLFRCNVSQAILPHLSRALHAVICELEDRDIGFEPGKGDYQGLQLTRDDDRVELNWREETVTLTREPTNEEKRRPSWSWQLTETKPSGQLSVEVSAVGLRGKRKWSESDGLSLEKLLGIVIDKVEAVFVGFEDQRKREAEWAKQRAEEAKVEAERRAQRAEQTAIKEKKRQEEERIERHESKLKKIADKRRENLITATERWVEAQGVAAFVETCEARWRHLGGGELSKAQSEWLTWARTHAANMEPFAEGYPDPTIDGALEKSTVPMGGPYPESRVWPDEDSPAAPAPAPAPVPVPVSPPPQMHQPLSPQFWWGYWQGKR